MMVTFLDGPAAGKTLDLRRAPFVLRVVINNRGTVDALDQLDDEIKPMEFAHVYRLTAPPQSIHVKAVKRSQSAWRYIASYALAPGAQPDQAILRDNERWGQWCEENKARLTEGVDWARFERDDSAKSAEPT